MNVTIGADFASLADISFNTLASVEDLDHVQTLVDSVVNTLITVQQNILVSDGSVWYHSSAGSYAYVMRFDAVIRNGTSLASDSSAITVVPHVLPSNALAVNAQRNGEPLLRDVRVATLATPLVTLSSNRKVVSGSVMVDVSDKHGIRSDTVQSQYTASDCSTIELTATTQLVCRLMCARYNEAASLFSEMSMTLVPGCVSSTVINNDGTSIATCSVNQPGFYVLIAEYIEISNVTSSAGSSDYISSSSSASFESSPDLVLLSSSSSIVDMSSSSEVVLSSTADHISESSTGPIVEELSSSSLAADSQSSTGQNVSQSSSSSAQAVVVAVTVQLDMTVSLSYMINASNFVSIARLFEQDIARNLAVPFDSTEAILLPYISVTSLGNYANIPSRRLLQVGPMHMSFIIRGDIGNVITVSETDPSQIGVLVANTLIAQVRNGSFVSSSAGADVPTEQTITLEVLTAVPEVTSSSSTGSIQVLSSSSSGPVSSVDEDSTNSNIGLGVGLGVGLVAFLYTKGVRPFRAATAGVGPRASIDDVELAKPPMKAAAPSPVTPMPVNIHTEEGEVIHVGDIPAFPQVSEQDEGTSADDQVRIHM